jgi:hypothetical protein
VHKGIAPAVDAGQLMVFSGAECLGVLAQQHRLVDRVAVGCGDSNNVINPGSGMQLVAQCRISGHAGHEGPNRRKRHEGVHNHAHL